MKKLILVLLIVLAAIAGYWYFSKTNNNKPGTEKAGPLMAKTHSDSFNNGIDSLLTAYFDMKEAFVNADTSAAKAACVNLVRIADSSMLDELKNDTVAIYQSALMLLGDVKANAESLLNQSDITEMRQDFRMVGESMYPLLKTIHYEGRTLYWQNCPMAFGEDNGANWISNTAAVVNPYLGKNHPTYKATMLHCGEVKDSIQAR